MGERFDFAVDQAHAKSVNETVARTRRRWQLSAVAAVVLAIGAVVLFSADHPWSYILCVVLVLATIVAVWVAISGARRSHSVDDLYARGSLVPAVIAATQPRGVILLSLVDVSKPGTELAHIALVTRAIRQLPGHGRGVGEQVPSVAVLHDRSSRGDPSTWGSVTILPIVWATTDRAVVEEAAARIDRLEWDLLHQNLSLVDKILGAENHRMLIDPHDLPGEMLRRRESE